jgi:hypothetical protein
MAERGAISLSARLQPFYTALLPGVRCSLVANIKHEFGEE